MDERVIRDDAGDLWAVEAAGSGRDGGGRWLCYRHELGYEVVVPMARPLAELDDRVLIAALEVERRRFPAAATSEAA